MSDLHQKLTAVVQYLSSVAQDLHNKTLTYLPTHTPVNIYRLKLSTIIAVIPVVTYLAWSYMTQPTKQKKRPDPITTTHPATIDAEQITPQDQIDKLNSEQLGQFAPRYSNLTDPLLDPTYQKIMRQDLSINANNFEPEEGDPDYDVLRYLTQVQRALLATRTRAHQDRVIASIREDWYDSVFAKGEDGEDTGNGCRKDDTEFMAEIVRCAD